MICRKTLFIRVFAFMALTPLRMSLAQSYVHVPPDHLVPPPLNMQPVYWTYATPQPPIQRPQNYVPSKNLTNNPNFMSTMIQWFGLGAIRNGTSDSNRYNSTVQPSRQRNYRTGFCNYCNFYPWIPMFPVNVHKPPTYQQPGKFTPTVKDGTVSVEIYKSEALPLNDLLYSNPNWVNTSQRPAVTSSTSSPFPQAQIREPTSIHRQSIQPTAPALPLPRGAHELTAAHSELRPDKIFVGQAGKVSPFARHSHDVEVIKSKQIADFASTVEYPITFLQGHSIDLSAQGPVPPRTIPPRIVPFPRHPFSYLFVNVSQPIQPFPSLRRPQESIAHPTTPVPQTTLSVKSANRVKTPPPSEWNVSANDNLPAASSLYLAEAGKLNVGKKNNQIVTKTPIGNNIQQNPKENPASSSASDTEKEQKKGRKFAKQLNSSGTSPNDLILPAKLIQNKVESANKLSSILGNNPSRDGIHDQQAKERTATESIVNNQFLAKHKAVNISSQQLETPILTNDSIHPEPFASKQHPRPFQPSLAAALTQNNLISELSKDSPTWQPTKLKNILVADLRELLQQEQANDLDISKLQQSIDDWTEQEYASLSHRPNTPTLNGKSKYIPLEYLTTPMPFTKKHLLNYNNINSAFSTSVNSLRALVLSDSSSRTKNKQDEDIVHRMLYPTNGKWRNSEVSISRGTNEKVYVVTPEPQFLRKESEKDADNLPSSRGIADRSAHAHIDLMRLSSFVSPQPVEIVDGNSKVHHVRSRSVRLV